VEDRLSDRKITLRLDEEAKNYLASSGYSPIYGARPLNRAIRPVVDAGHLRHPPSMVAFSLPSRNTVNTVELYASFSSLSASPGPTPEPALTTYPEPLKPEVGEIFYHNKTEK
jgi:hypothetical protein